jgi:inorganic pyrophosphatase
MDLEKLPSRCRGGFHVVVESPAGSRLKLKYEPDLKAIVMHRPLPLGYAYPHDWGFVPSTRAADGDPVDAMIYWDAPSYPGVVVPCRPLGVLELEQDAKAGGRERNDRILAVPLAHPRGEGLRTIDDVPARAREELVHFFVSSVAFEPKHPRVLGWKGPEAAEALIAAGERALR